MVSVLQGALPAGIARLDVELDALVLTQRGGGSTGSGGSGGSGRRLRGRRHFEDGLFGFVGREMEICGRQEVFVWVFGRKSMRIWAVVKCEKRRAEGRRGKRAS